MSVFTSGEEGSPDIVVDFLEVAFLALNNLGMMKSDTSLFCNEDHCFCSSSLLSSSWWRICTEVKAYISLNGVHGITRALNANGKWCSAKRIALVLHTNNKNVHNTNIKKMSAWKWWAKKNKSPNEELESKWSNLLCMWPGERRCKFQQPLGFTTIGQQTTSMFENMGPTKNRSWPPKKSGQIALSLYSWGPPTLLKHLAKRPHIYIPTDQYTTTVNKEWRHKRKKKHFP